KTEKIFGSIWSTFTPAKPEAAPFTGEPPREAMTAPPSGYQTPSPNYPYGTAGQDKRKASPPEERVEGRQKAGTVRDNTPHPHLGSGSRRLRSRSAAGTCIVGATSSPTRANSCPRD